MLQILQQGAPAPATAKQDAQAAADAAAHGMLTVLHDLRKASSRMAKMQAQYESSPEGRLAAAAAAGLAEYSEGIDFVPLQLRDVQASFEATLRLACR